MRLSRYFLPILKETPKEAEIVSHRLMLRAGMIRQEAAGIYAWLPLGLRVLHKICAIVREEQNRSGAIELLMPTIQSAELWRESGRYDDYGKEMLRIRDRHERDMLYGPTNEEMITEIFRANVRSYKDLPLNLYHIQWKFRDEVRPRFGVMRSREFLMKDAYSFDLDAAGARHSYNKMFTAYLAHLLALRPHRDPDARRHRADRRRPLPRIHHPRRHRRERGVLPQGLSRASRRRPRTIDFDSVEAMQGVFDKWTSLYAATSEKHDAAAFERIAPRFAHFGARHRGRPYFLLRNQVFRADEGGRQRPRRQGALRAHGFLRHRPEPARRRADRGEPRRSRHDLARGGGALRRRRRSISRSATRPATAPARASTPRSARRASRRSTTTATSAPARNSPRWTSSACPHQVDRRARRASPRARSRSRTAAPASASSSASRPRSRGSAGRRERSDGGSRPALTPALSRERERVATPSPACEVPAMQGGREAAG